MCSHIDPKDFFDYLYVNKIIKFLSLSNITKKFQEESQRLWLYLFIFYLFIYLVIFNSLKASWEQKI